MSRDDPLETWHLDGEILRSLSPQRRAQLDAQARAALDELQRFLDDPPPRGNLGDVRIGLLPEAYGLPRDQVLRAQESASWQKAARATPTCKRICSN